MKANAMGSDGSSRHESGDEGTPCQTSTATGRNNRRKVFDNAEIVKSPIGSVSELKGWLTEFERKNKVRYEKHLVKQLSAVMSRERAVDTAQSYLRVLSDRAEVSEKPIDPVNELKNWLAEFGRRQKEHSEQYDTKKPRLSSDGQCHSAHSSKKGPSKSKPFDGTNNETKTKDVSRDATDEASGKREEVYTRKISDQAEEITTPYQPVSELKSWLTDFGNKNKDHYDGRYSPSVRSAGVAKKYVSPDATKLLDFAEDVSTKVEGIIAMGSGANKGVGDYDLTADESPVEIENEETDTVTESVTADQLDVQADDVTELTKDIIHHEDGEDQLEQEQEVKDDKEKDDSEKEVIYNAENNVAFSVPKEGKEVLEQSDESRAEEDNCFGEEEQSTHEVIEQCGNIGEENAQEVLESDSVSSRKEIENVANRIEQAVEIETNETDVIDVDTQKGQVVSPRVDTAGEQAQTIGASVDASVENEVKLMTSFPDLQVDSFENERQKCKRLKGIMKKLSCAAMVFKGKSNGKRTMESTGKCGKVTDDDTTKPRDYPSLPEEQVLTMTSSSDERYVICDDQMKSPAMSTLGVGDVVFEGKTMRAAVEGASVFSPYAEKLTSELVRTAGIQDAQEPFPHGNQDVLSKEPRAVFPTGEENCAGGSGQIGQASATQERMVPVVREWDESSVMSMDSQLDAEQPLYAKLVSLDAIQPEDGCCGTHHVKWLQTAFKVKRP